MTGTTCKAAYLASSFFITILTSNLSLYYTLGFPSLSMTGTTCKAAYLASSFFITILTSNSIVVLYLRISELVYDWYHL